MHACGSGTCHPRSGPCTLQAKILADWSRSLPVSNFTLSSHWAGVAGIRLLKIALFKKCTFPTCASRKSALFKKCTFSTCPSRKRTLFEKCKFLLIYFFYIFYQPHQIHDFPWHPHPAQRPTHAPGRNASSYTGASKWLQVVISTTCNHLLAPV